MKADNILTDDGLDVRFAVNTIAPYLLTKELLPLLVNNGRVINLSSAAQADVDLDALVGRCNEMNAMEAYSQSKLAIAMWSRNMSEQLGKNKANIIAINPGSLLGSKMVKEGFGIVGKDISIGAKILVHAALSDEFANASGKYFDNDKGDFSEPHPDVLDVKKCEKLLSTIEEVIAKKS